MYVKTFSIFSLNKCQRYVLYIEDITWQREDMNFILGGKNNILRTSAESKILFFYHEKI